MATSATTTTTLQRTPAKPFYFNTSAHLLRITKYKANSLAELLDALRECPEDSVFQHTFRTLQEHHFIREGFSNDFAHWALAQCNEPGLAAYYPFDDGQGLMCGNSLPWGHCEIDSS